VKPPIIATMINRTINVTISVCQLPII